MTAKEMKELRSIRLDLSAYSDFKFRDRCTFRGKKDAGNSYSRAAAVSENGTCTNCGGYLFLADNGDYLCEDCAQSVLNGYNITFNRLYGGNNVL